MQHPIVAIIACILNIFMCLVLTVLAYSSNQVWEQGGVVAEVVAVFGGGVGEVVLAGGRRSALGVKHSAILKRKHASAVQKTSPFGIRRVTQRLYLSLFLVIT